MSDKESRAITVTTGNTATTKWIISIVVAATLAGVMGFIVGVYVSSTDEDVQSRFGREFGENRRS